MTVNQAALLYGGDLIGCKSSMFSKVSWLSINPLHVWKSERACGEDQAEFLLAIMNTLMMQPILSSVILSRLIYSWYLLLGQDIMFNWSDGSLFDRYLDYHCFVATLILTIPIVSYENAPSSATLYFIEIVVHTHLDQQSMRRSFRRRFLLLSIDVQCYSV